MGFGYAVAITMDPIAAGNHRGEGSFGWGGAGGTMSWVDPEHELVAVRMMQLAELSLRKDLDSF